MAGPITTIFGGLVRQQVADWPAEPDIENLDAVLRLIGRWRSHILSRTYQAHHGVRVMGGLFAGMEFVSEAAEGPLIPKLLGVYEDELHPHLTAFMAEGVDAVIDIGCAEGYYAVGLAQALPGVQIHAYDIDENARRVCAELAERNGVAGQVIVGGEFRPEGFQAFAGRRVMVIVDTEGAELDILQPALSPALAGMKIIVETHDVFRPGALDTLVARFSPTHDIVRVDQQPKTPALPSWLADLPQLDQLLAVWEWREAPTPWLVMRPKGG